LGELILELCPLKDMEFSKQDEGTVVAIDAHGIDSARLRKKKEKDKALDVWSSLGES
jgi:hypothetical protein